MVRRLGLLLTLIMCLPAHALFGRTQADLRALEDRLRYEFGASGERRADRDPNVSITPILIAPPQAYWQESKEDFAPAVMESLSHVFKNSGDMIQCALCYENRVYLTNDNRMVTQTGELGIADLARLRQNPAYKAAKSVMTIEETPSGISVRVVSVDDGRILYAGVADSTKTLSDAEAPLRLARELDRRARGEALSYVNFDIGFWPDATVQLKFLEQWGSRNQHMSGFVISGFNPTGALGVNYTYMLPWFDRHMTASATGFYKLQSMFSNNNGNSDTSTSSTGRNSDASVVGELKVGYAFSGSYGMFVSGNTDGFVSIGISLMNPVLFPFLL